MQNEDESLDRPLLPDLDAIQEQIDAMEAQSRNAVFGEDREGGKSEKNQGLFSSELGKRERSEPPVPSLIYSTFLSLIVVLVLLGAIRWMLPELLEWCRYSWTRGQLRAEYEVAGEQLRQVSMDRFSEVSNLVSRRVSPSVVHIDMKKNRSEEIPIELKQGFDVMDGIRVDQGSGVIVDSEGHIVTNHHVIEEGGRIETLLSDGRTIRASVRGIDPVTDLAVLKIDAEDLLPISWGDSDEVKVGMPVWAVGSPFGLTGSVTFGVVSGKHRIDLSSMRMKGDIKSKAEYSDLMQSDVAVNPGNSGGPLVNAQGELIGINTAIIGESYRGVSFSIPSNVVKKVVEKILATGVMERGILGIIVDKEYQPRKTGEGRPGLRVQSFASDASPALRAGVRIGDIILKVNGMPVEDIRDLRRIVGEAYIGSQVEVVLLRDDSEISLLIEVVSPV